MNWEKEVIPVKELATGEQLSITVHTLKGDKPGPHIHIQSSVHGAELQGNAVILKLMEELQKEIISGSISFIPLANPYATNNKHGTYTYGRYNPVTGHNWNRNYVDFVSGHEKLLKEFCQKHFESDWELIKKEYKELLTHLLESHVNNLRVDSQINDNNKLNLELQKLALKADGILDFHTGPVATRYLYTAEYAKEVSSNLLFKNVLVIPNEFGGSMDEAGFMPWVHLMNMFNELGREITPDIESFTLEFGSEETFCMEWAQKDVESVLNYLRYKKVIGGEPKKQETHYSKLEDFITLYSSKAGIVDYRVKTGDHVKKGDVLAHIYQFKNLDPENPVTSTQHEVISNYDGIIINYCPSSSVHEGMEMFQMMRNITKF
jgi:predicted deacylase